MRTMNPSRDVKRAAARADRLTDISPALDLGSGLSLKAFTAMIADYRATLSAYNATLGHAAALHLEIGRKDAAIRDLADRFLQGIASHFGTDSHEYAAAGGTPKSVRRHRKRNSEGVAPSDVVPK